MPSDAVVIKLRLGVLPVDSTFEGRPEIFGVGEAEENVSGGFKRGSFSGVARGGVADISHRSGLEDGPLHLAETGKHPPFGIGYERVNRYQPVLIRVVLEPLVYPPGQFRLEAFLVI